MQTEKSKEEAARLTARYLGCKVRSFYLLTEDYETNVITGAHIQAVQNGFVKSFQILLRSIDEMTEEEIKKSWTYLSASPDSQGIPKSEFTIEYFDYLRSIGVATNEEDRNLIIIKN